VAMPLAAELAMDRVRISPCSASGMPYTAMHWILDEPSRDEPALAFQNVKGAS
jgi:hypothetical protein